MKRYFLALLLVLPSMVAAQSVPAMYAPGVSISGINSERLVVWTALKLEERADPSMQRLRENLFERLPLTLFKGDATDKENLLASLNKVVELSSQRLRTAAPSPKGEFEKTAEYEARIADEQKKSGATPNKAKIMSALLQFYLGEPEFKIDSYDADTEVMKLRVVSTKYAARDLEQLVLPFEIKIAPKYALKFKENRGYAIPAVYFDLNSTELTVKFIDVIYDSSLRVLTEGSDFFKNGQLYNKKIDFAFGPASAANYEKDLVGRAQMRRSRYDADRQKMQWYPLYAKFMDAPVGCQLMKQEILAASAMNGASPEGQVKTLEYAKRIAAKASNCLK
jgi:hypothetical protein